MDKPRPYQGYCGIKSPSGGLEGRDPGSRDPASRGQCVGLLVPLGFQTRLVLSLITGNIPMSV